MFLASDGTGRCSLQRRQHGMVIVAWYVWLDGEADFRTQVSKYTLRMKSDAISPE